MSDDGLGSWDPLSLGEVSAVMGGVDCPWWVAGGWAIDLHIGRMTRDHDDKDVLLLREDHLRVQRHLSGWDLYAADPPGSLRRWLPGEVLPFGVHDIWCRRSRTAPWSLQLMLNETENGAWVYRRDSRIRRPIVELLGPASTPLLPVLSPEIQLLYKSEAPRAKDELDFESVIPALDGEQRAWLARALATVSPGHPWLDVLRSPGAT
ncbi:MAG: amino acid transporter [Nocardioides sp.]|uniref:nucleotidyltransferase domain-containing protein n=1 Tax=Nocardioides sp. TaxID=35761 RepID=UPI0039E724A1